MAFITCLIFQGWITKCLHIKKDGAKFSFSKHHLSWKSDRRCLTIVPNQTFTFIWFVIYCSRYLNNLCFPTLDAYYCKQEIRTLDVKCTVQIECKILVFYDEAYWHQNVVDLIENLNEIVWPTSVKFATNSNSNPFLPQWHPGSECHFRKL